MKKNSKIGNVMYGKPAKGCEQCIKGEKLVLFVTGLCDNRCFYCPISEKKFGKKAVYANEWKIKNDADLLTEARLTDAKGAGVTGGDPLIETEKTCKYIKKLKKEFGKKFHIHLYTSPKPVTEEKLKQLYLAGLDEIRFHLNLNRPKEWNVVLLAKKYPWAVGVEIPSIPGTETQLVKLIDFLEGKVDFLNLNELEFSDTNIAHYNLKRFEENTITHSAKGSSELAEKIIRCAEKKKLNLSVYFCSTKLKNKVQMGQRIKRRAKNVALPFDKVTSEGMIRRGIVYLKELQPGFSYRKKLLSANKKIVLKKLLAVKNQLKTLLKEVVVDDEKLRLIVSQKELKISKDKVKALGFVPAIVEEYPTKDSFEVEIDFL
ncbi:MAG: radical SAM protein [Nanoarchaeota archaeon]